MTEIFIVGDADRVIKAGGVHINGLKVTEPQFVLIPGEHILPNGLTLIRIGNLAIKPLQHFSICIPK